MKAQLLAGKVGSDGKFFVPAPGGTLRLEGGEVSGAWLKPGQRVHWQMRLGTDGRQRAVGYTISER